MPATSALIDPANEGQPLRTCAPGRDSPGKSAPSLSSGR